MSWHTDKRNEITSLIMDDERLVGSICREGEMWKVEILWSGPGGDITGSFAEYKSALAFVKGVEWTVAAFGMVSL
jgi:hypothetical protein